MKKIALIIATVVLIALTFVFWGSAESIEDDYCGVLCCNEISAIEANAINCEITHTYKEWVYNYKTRYRICEYCFERQEEPLETYTDGYYIYTVLNGEAALVGVTTELAGDVILPSTLGGYPLVALEGAFLKNETVTSVIIPEGVRYIGSGTFEECKTKLVKVVMPDTVTEIGSGAFMECYNLEEVVLSKNIKVIDMYTFEQCYSLKELNLPEGLETVGCISMTGCASLEELVFPDSVEMIQGYTLLNNSFSLKRIVIGKNAKSCDDHNGGFSGLVSLEDVYVYSSEYDFTNSMLGYISMGPDLNKITKEEWVAIYVNVLRNSDNHQEITEDFEKFLASTVMYEEPRVSDTLTIHGVHNSKVEVYAKENGIKFEYIHDFSNGEWTYDYENNVRTRKCIHCDELQVEELENEEPDTPDEPAVPDTPEKPNTSDCKCLCHKDDVFSVFLMSIFRFLTKLLGVFPICDCGVAHY